MLHVYESARSGSRLARRDFLRLGALGFGGLTLCDLLRVESHSKPAKRPKSLIYVVLSGGPSHIDMYDLKPEAPIEYRGPFQPIATSLVGAQICQWMPEQAKLLDRCALVRGIRSVENDHYLAEVYTGLPRSAGRRPAFGSLVSRLAPSTNQLPAYMSLSREPIMAENNYERPHYAGARHAPFRPHDEALSDLTPVKSLDQLQARRTLLSAFDQLKQSVDKLHEYAALDTFQSQALQIITSSAVRDAFDLSQEPADMLDRYGHKRGHFTHQTVKSLLYQWEAKNFVLARRLIEAGARVVTVQVDNWDHHSGASSDIFYSLEQMLPALDRTLCALFNDLRDRGLDQDVGVVVLGEFGRTPKVSYPGPGREHWADAGCALFYGGGFKTGQVIGATDSRAERSVDGKIGFENIMATIYQMLGVDTSIKLPDFNGRPQHLLNDREPIRALLG